MASISPAPLNTPNSRTLVALTRPRPSSSSRYCQRYPTRGPAFRLTMAKTVPSRTRRYRAIPIGSPASPASPSNTGRPPGEETSVSALPSLAIRNTRNRRRRRSVRTAMSVAWPCSISPYSTSTLLGRSMPASVCRPLPSKPKTTSAPLGAGALFVPRIKLRSGTDAWIQTAGSSGSSDTGAVARVGRTSTGTWAGEQAAQNIATTTEPSRVSVRTVSFSDFMGGRPWVDALAAFHRAAVGVGPTRHRYEFPVVGTIFQRQVQNTVRAVIASDAVRSRVFKFEEALAAGTDHKGLRAVRVGLASGVLRRKALIEVIVALQNDIDVLDDQEVNPGFDASFLAVTAGRAGKVRLVPVGDRT